MRGNGPRPQHRQIKGGKGKLLDILVNKDTNEDENEATVGYNGIVMGLVPHYHILRCKQPASSICDFSWCGNQKSKRCSFSCNFFLHYHVYITNLCFK